MGWLITLGILALLAGMPLGISVCYDSSGLLMRVIAGLFKVQVLPSKSKSGNKDQKENAEPKSVAEKKTVKQTKTRKKENAEKAKKKGGSVLDFMPLVQLVLEFLGKFTRKLRVNRMELCLVLAGDDPCDLAVNYGKAWAALGNLWPRLEEIFLIKKRDVEIQCDFEASQTLVTARLDISISLGRLVSLVVYYAVRALIQYMKITDKRKGGAAI